MPFSLVQIREQLQEYNPVRSSIKDVKAAISLIVCADSLPGDEDCVMQLRENLPPGTLYSQEMVNGPTTLYRLFRDYLGLKGCHFKQHPERNRISFGLPGTLYDNQVDRDISLKALGNARSTITSNNQPEDVNNSRLTTMHEEPFYQSCSQHGRQVQGVREIFCQTSTAIVVPQVQRENGNDRDGNPRVCYNCGSPDHFIRDCDQPRNLTRNIDQMLRNNPNDAKRILFELCQQSEEALFENDESPFFDEDDHGDDQDDEEDDL